MQKISYPIIGIIKNFPLLPAPLRLRSLPPAPCPRTLSVAEVGAVAFALTLFSAYIGWRTMKGDEKQALIRNIAVAFAATGGTSFRGANLTDADFTGATLKNTDLRKSILIRTCWRNTKKLDLIRPGNTYLQNTQVRQLLLTGQGQDKSFDDLKLRGINLQGANLQDASFIAADLSEANLQDADLSRVKLKQTQLDATDLTGLMGNLVILSNRLWIP